VARQFSVLLIATVAVGCVAGASLAYAKVVPWPVGGAPVLTKADFDQAFADASLQAAIPSQDKLRAAGLKRVNGQRLLQGFWVAAIASPYLGAKNADLLQPLNHMPSLAQGNFAIDED